MPTYRVCAAHGQKRAEVLRYRTRAYRGREAQQHNACRRPAALRQTAEVQILRDNDAPLRRGEPSQFLIRQSTLTLLSGVPYVEPISPKLMGDLQRDGFIYEKAQGILPR